MLEETEAIYSGILLLSDVGWLSRSRALNHFYDLLPEIEAFLSEKGDLLHKWKKRSVLQTCIFSQHLMDLNKKLQGKKHLAMDTNV